MPKSENIELNEIQELDPTLFLHPNLIAQLSPTNINFFRMPSNQQVITSNVVNDALDTAIHEKNIENVIAQLTAIDTSELDEQIKKSILFPEKRRILMIYQKFMLDNKNLREKVALAFSVMPKTFGTAITENAFASSYQLFFEQGEGRLAYQDIQKIFNLINKSNVPSMLSFTMLIMQALVEMQIDDVQQKIGCKK